MTVPSLIFIVPYRDRELQKSLFLRNMQYILEDEQDYEIYFSHQMDDRTFNRGAMKNIGFLAIKEKYPDHYQNITFVFNDIDTFPIEKLFSYRTTRNIVKHFYGFRYALGGIVSITGFDFERINGFPNFWGWGFEDNDLQKRVENAGIQIDRSQFYKIFDMHVVQLHNDTRREVNLSEANRYKQNISEGVREIHELQFTIEKNMIQVSKYMTQKLDMRASNIQHDLRKGNIKVNKRRKGGLGMAFN